MALYSTIQQTLGLGADPRNLTFIQISLRAVIVFFAALVMVRMANRRFLSKMSPFDVILGFILASMLARAVNGTVSFFPTLGAGFVLVGIHAVIAALSYRSDAFGRLVKGSEKRIVQDGKVDRKMMAKTHLSEKDLLEEARLNGCVPSLHHIHLATLERNGQVSIIPTNSHSPDRP
jgi:uncharacterized membrane protein YcaP (DUF421 family)